jgi:hypothetical protein
MKKWSRYVLCLASLLVLVPTLRAQAIYTATRTSRIQAGVGGSYIQPDYADKAILGISAWGDYDFNSFLGLEATIHLGDLITPNDFTEVSYLVGPRLLYHRRKLTVYGKAMIGHATITNQLKGGESSGFNTYAYGGGLEYRLGRKFNLRAIDVELQQWPNFEPHTLSPMLYTVGLSYIIR